jgi:hypothetical protein
LKVEVGKEKRWVMEEGKRPILTESFDANGYQTSAARLRRVYEERVKDSIQASIDRLVTFFSPLLMLHHPRKEAKNPQVDWAWCEDLWEGNLTGHQNEEKTEEVEGLMEGV